jgi:hypothetical protein
MSKIDCHKIQDQRIACRRSSVDCKGEQHKLHDEQDMQQKEKERLWQVVEQDRLHDEQVRLHDEQYRLHDEQDRLQEEELRLLDEQDRLHDPQDRLHDPQDRL